MQRRLLYKFVDWQDKYDEAGDDSSPRDQRASDLQLAMRISPPSGILLLFENEDPCLEILVTHSHRRCQSYDAPADDYILMHG